MPMKLVTIDGRHLSYPGTGLALVVSEFLRAFYPLGYDRHISVLVGHDFNPAQYGLEHLRCNWIEVDYTQQYPKLARLLAKAAAIPDYLERWVWAQAVQAELAKIDQDYQHFIPYLYNYGDRKRNIVLVPDLNRRLGFPLEKVVDPNRSWWSQLRYKLPLRYYLERWEEELSGQAERLVVYSDFVKDSVAQELKVPAAQISMIPLAAPSLISDYLSKNMVPRSPESAFTNAAVESVAIDTIAPNHEFAALASELRSQYKLPDRFVLYVGGFGDRKNVPMLMRACGKAYAQDNSFRCVFVGMTDNFLASSRGYRFRRELDHPAVNHATIKMPSLDYAQLATMYTMAEFTVYPSFSEGFGLPIIEAAAAGRMCLCGDNSSMPEIQPHTEYRIDSQDETAWVDRILFFWQNPQLAIAAGAKCAKIVDLFSWQTSAEQLWQLLQADYVSADQA
jgi:glycosyltransferase involved in cell wall biosynthesis